MEQNKALLERIRLFVLDLDGTIYLGDRLLPGAAEFITTAKEKGRRVLFFTNNTSRSPMEYVERLSRMGIPVTREDILTAGDVTIHYLQTHCAGQSVYLLGVPALRQSFAEAGISLTEEQPDLVVVGFDKTLTYERLEKACIYLRRAPISSPPTPISTAPLRQSRSPIAALSARPSPPVPGLCPIPWASPPPKQWSWWKR